MPNDLAAVRAGVWPNYERLNQRSKLGVSAAAAQRGDGAEERRDWRGYALTLAERLAVLDARLQQQRGQAAASHVAANKAPPGPEATRKARR